MSVDLSQFLDLFFEESFEGLDVMESGLLELNPGEPDIEAVNTIFRAAHSIKGASATFGMKDIADFTHVMETLLDEMREGKCAVTQDIVSLFLQSVDCLRNMMNATRDEAPIDKDEVSGLQHDLETMLTSKENVVCQAVADSNTASQSAVSGWHIKFNPHLQMLKTGNDPVRMFRELAQLGTLEVKVDTSKLPSLEDCDSDECYLAWELELQAEVGREQIVEIFEWVDMDCDLEISQLGESDINALDSQIEHQSLEHKDVQNGIEKDSVSDEFQAQPTSTSRKKPEVKEQNLGEKRREAGSESTSIRVGIDKVDALINMVGELVITQSMLSQFSENFDIRNLEKLRDGLALLERNTRELQESVMQIRMLPISFAFNRFPRLVRDLSNKLGKKIELKLSGEQTELDKTVMEKIGDPLVHLVRNSLDHGIELPEVRVAAGKPETGVLSLNAFHEGGNIVIEIADDGAGLNKEKIFAKAKAKGLVGENEDIPDDKINELVFMPGFSTAEEVSDVSGRGVGMDVVRRNIKDLEGVVEVRSEEGIGSTFTIRLPLTLAILDGQLVKVGEQIYIVPLVSITESLQIKTSQINSVAGQADLFRLRDDYIPIVRLHQIFEIESHSIGDDNGLLVVVEADGQKIGIFVDDLLAQQQIVIKSLETNFQKVGGISGATILGDGKVALILDISGIISLSRNRLSRSDRGVSKKVA